mmetsp:Transcript_22973/g.22319  ORF Transcript_22973/g.22319 Transcript_22973/m.22319 type:complete len:133 (+) Transcript_22973:541-939(+)
MSGPEPYQFGFTELEAGLPITQSLAVDDETLPHKVTYRWYNEGGGDFQLSIDNLEGEFYAFLSFISEETYFANIYQSVPLNDKNALWSTPLNTSEQVALRIYKDGTPEGLFCYYCYYYVTILTNYTVAQSSY